MRGTLQFITVALASIAMALPKQGYQFAKYKRDANNSLPIPVDQITALYTATGIAPDIIKPLPTLSPFQGTPVGISPLPAVTRAAPANATTYLGVNARLPPFENVSPSPEIMTPFNQSGTSQRDVFGRQACDPGIYCCPDPRRLFESTRFPWETVGRTATASPTTKGSTQFCTATWIGRRLILTASHCVNCK